MKKEIIKLENGYLLKKGNNTWFFEDFATCIVNAFSEEFETMHNSNMCLTIKAEIE